jgi:hypothetical protein
MRETMKHELSVEELGKMTTTELMKLIAPYWIRFCVEWETRSSKGWKGDFKCIMD